MAHSLGSAPVGGLVGDTATGAPPPQTIDQALAVVLERTRQGDEELKQPRLPLGQARRELLAAVDGVKRLALLTRPDAVPNAQRLVSDAARLVAFGLCRTRDGELPRRAMVEAMNLTLRLPASFGTPREAAAPDAMTPPSERRYGSDSAVGPRALLLALLIVLTGVWVGWEWLRR